MADATLTVPDAKFRHPDVTATGERRARVPLLGLRTLWINTGSLCNIACRNCYIESSPENDRLAYISREEAALYFDEVAHERWPVTEIGFTGGEPLPMPFRASQARKGGGFRGMECRTPTTRNCVSPP